MLVKKTIPHTKLNRIYPSSPFINQIHSTAIQITQNKKTYIIGGYYNSPTKQDKNKPIQFLEYLNTLSADNIIFIGDLNIKHPYLGDINASPMALPFLDVINDTHYTIYQTDDPTHESNSFLDLIIGTDGQNKNINSLKVHNEWISDYNIHSDHYPIFFNYQTSFDPNIRKKYKTWNFNSKNWNKYKRILDKHFDPKTFLFINPNNIDLTWANIYNMWLRILNSTIGKKTIYNKPTPWWTKKIHKLQKKCKSLSRRNQRLKKKKNLKNKHKIQYKKVLKLKKKAIKQAKHNLNNLIKQTIKSNKNDSTFWKAINGFNKQPSLYIPPLHNNLPNNPNKILYSDKEKAEALHYIIKNPPQPTNIDIDTKNHWINIENWFSKYIKNPSQTQYNIPKTNPYNKYYTKPFMKPYNEPMDSTYKIKNELYNLNKPFTIVELNNNISDLDTGKVMGPLNLHNKMLKHTGPKFRKTLLNFFNKCWRIGCTPSDWFLDVISPIPKPNKDHSYPKNYRPIAVSCIVGRLFQKIVAKRLQCFTIKLNIFKPNQSGFQMNRSCIDAIIPLYQTILHSQDIQSATQLLQTDFSKAYDTVWHKGLIYKLYKLGIQGKILKWITFFISNRYTTVKYNKIKSDKCKQTIGLPQGSSLSPILYILYTNDYKLTKIGQKCLLKGCFADDTIFWNKPCSLEFFNKYIPKIMNYEYHNFNKWANKWKLVLAPEKNIWSKFHNENEDNIDNSDDSDIDINNNDYKSNVSHDTMDMNTDPIHIQIQNSNVFPNKVINKYNKRKKAIQNNNLNNPYPNPSLNFFEKNFIEIQKTPKNDIKEVTRYLGTELDKYLNFDKHKAKIIKNSYYNLLMTRKLIAKKFPINMNTLHIMYNAKTRSRLEYAIQIFLNQKNIGNSIVQKIQNEALRLILNLPKTTPIQLLHFILQAPFIQDRYEYYITKLYIKSKYVHNNHPLAFANKEYEKYISIINNKDILNTIYKNNIPRQSQFKSFNKHPIPIAKLILKKLKHPLSYIPSMSPQFKQTISALPCNIINKPINLIIIHRSLNFDKSYPKHWNIFNCDGSSITNPGRGAGCFSCFKHPSKKYFKDINTVIPFEINYYEIYTLHNIFQFLIDNPLWIAKINVINCDSKNALDWLDNRAKIKYRAIQIQIEEIYKKINYLNEKYKIEKFIIQKVKSHSRVKLHNEVDLKAKIAANNMTINPNLNKYLPYYIQINYLKKYLHKQRNKNWQTYRNNKILLNHNNLHMLRPIVRVFDSNTLKLKKYLNNIINHTDRGILIQLMCGETPTNEYYRKYKFLKTKCCLGLCEYCLLIPKVQCKEDITHIIYQCPNYTKIRNDIRHDMVHLNQQYNDDDTYYNIDNLLFPWKNEKIIPKNSKDRITLQIWKLLIQYCKRTNNKAFDPTRNLLIK